VISADDYSEACEDREALLALVQELKAQVIDYPLLVARLDEVRIERDALKTQILELQLIANEKTGSNDSILKANRTLLAENATLKMRLNEWAAMTKPLMDAEAQAPQLGVAWSLLAQRKASSRRHELVEKAYARHVATSRAA
jgi:hypothetical protein